MTVRENPWDVYAEEYAVELVRRGPLRDDDAGLAARLMAELGDVSEKDVLDAGCGEGLLARLLGKRGARVTGRDLSPRLIAMAKAQDPDGAIDYAIADLSQPQPELNGRFDAIGSYLVLNDVVDHRGFARTLASAARPGAPVVLVFNNPYSLVVRGHITDYFANGSVGMYQGMRKVGIHAEYVHRTLEEFLDAFITAGFVLTRLVDVPDATDRDWLLPKGVRFPLFTILAFRKPKQD